MYDIYLKNYYENGSLVKTEKRLYSIPIKEEDIDYVLTDPSVSCSVGKTGSFEFTIYPNHPYYHAIAQMRTIMRVEYDGDTIFRGRILTVDNTLTGAKKIHCEGDMAFLLDSYQMSSKKEDRPSITINAYITKVLNEHNRQMSESGETDKCIYPGYVPGNYPSSFTNDQKVDNKSDKFGSNSSEQSMNALESLTKEFGGFFRTRYNKTDNKVYLDWCRNWFRRDLNNSQPIAITQNIIDAQSNSEVENIFTALIPVGKKEGKDIFINGYKTNIHGDNNRILVPQITNVYTAEQLDTGYVNESIFEKAVEQYGIIYKVQSFSNADTQAKLWSYACDWIRHNYVGGITNYDLTAVDMHHIDGTVEKYLVGDCVKLRLPPDLTELDEYIDDNVQDRSAIVHRTILTIKYNLHNPEKNSYSCGIASDILNLEYGVASTSKSKGGGKGGASSKGGGNDNNIKTIGGDSAWTEKQLNNYAWKYVIDNDKNKVLYDQLMAEDPSGHKAAAAHKASHESLVQDIRMTETQEDGSIQEKASAWITTMKLDADLAIIKFFTPMMYLIEGQEAGDRNVQLQAAKTMEINGYDQYISMKNLSTYHKSTVPDVTVNVPGVDVIENVTEIVDDTFDAFGLVSKAGGAFMSFLGGSKDDNKVTSTTNGETGVFGIMKNILGNDGSGDESKGTIVEDGTGNNGKGTVSIGRGGNKQWLIQMNKPLQYKDEDGTTHTVPDGIIDANDFATIKSGLKSIPSFVTQIGVFDTLIANNIAAINLKADKADFNSLSAKVANIEKITSGAVVATRLHVNNMDIDGTLRLKAMSWGNNNTVRLVPFSSLGMATYVLAVQ